MAISLSNLSDNLAEGLHKSKWKDFMPRLEYMVVKDGLLICKCVDFNKTFEKTFQGNLVKRLENTYCFCDRVFPYEETDEWERPKR